MCNFKFKVLTYKYNRIRILHSHARYYYDFVRILLMLSELLFIISILYYGADERRIHGGLKKPICTYIFFLNNVQG